MTCEFTQQRRAPSLRAVTTALLAASTLMAVPASHARAEDPTFESTELRLASKKLADYLEAYRQDRESSQTTGAFQDMAEYLGDLEKRKEIQFLKHPNMVAELLSSTLDVQRSGYPAGRTKTFKNDETLVGRKYTNEYTLWLPRSYKPDESWPMILALPPKDMKGDKYLRDVYSKDEAISETFIIAVPTLKESNFSQKGSDREDPNWFSNPGLFQCLALTLKEVRETYSVDRNRILLEGFEDGGEAAFRIATSFPDLFAGLIVREAAVPADAYVANLKHVPVFYTVSESDKDLVQAADNAAKLAANAKLENFTLKKVAATRGPLVEANADILAFAKDLTRPNYPAEVELYANEKRYGSAYWLRIDSMEFGAEHRAHVIAKIDKAANRIDVTCENVYSYEIRLCDEMLDLDKPIEVVTNGQTSFSGKKDRSLQYAIQRFSNSGDVSRVYVNSLEVTVDGNKNPQPPGDLSGK